MVTAGIRQPRGTIAYHESVTEFGERLQRVEQDIAEACRRSGRPREEVRLMGVSKMHPPERIADAVHAGLTLFGENRVQEFESKRDRLTQLGVAGAEVHLIGHLQSNKSARAAEIFHAVDSVDSMRVAERLNDAAGKLGKALPVLIEIKLSAEPTKSGVEPGSAELESLLERLPHWSHLDMKGLMTIAPLDERPATARTCFRQLHLLRNDLARRYLHLDFRELSMGMSGDFEIAIEEGSTLVRIGTALFGERLREP